MWLSLLCASVMYRIPRLWKYATLARSPSIGAPFSIPNGRLILPAAKLARTLATVGASANLSGALATMPSTTSMSPSATFLAPLPSNFGET